MFECTPYSHISHLLAVKLQPFNEHKNSYVCHPEDSLYCSHLFLHKNRLVQLFPKWNLAYSLHFHRQPWWLYITKTTSITSTPTYPNTRLFTTTTADNLPWSLLFNPNLNTPKTSYENFRFYCSDCSQPKHDTQLNNCKLIFHELELMKGKWWIYLWDKKHVKNHGCNSKYNFLCGIDINSDMASNHMLL